MAESYCIQSKVREAIKKANLRMSADAIDELNKRVEDIIRKAADRCKANGRQTIRPADF